MSVRLFVYGTLMRGAAQGHRMSSCQFLGPVRTLPQYELIDLGSYPALVEGGGTAVSGQLFEVPGHLLAALDAYEGSEYRRVVVQLEGGSSAEAYVMERRYCMADRRIPSGSWLARLPTGDPVE